MSKPCIVCGKSFKAKTNAVACSAECKRQRRISREKAWQLENGERYNERRREWAKANPEDRDVRRARQYGITLEKYKAMFARQKGRCWICEKPFPSNRGRSGPTIDHCHQTGRVRRLLCLRCNTAIGMLREDPRIIESALRYVRQHARVNKLLGA